MKLHLLLSDEMKPTLPHTIEVISDMGVVNWRGVTGDNVILKGSENDFLDWLKPFKKVIVGTGFHHISEFTWKDLIDVFKIEPIKVHVGNYVRENPLSSRYGVLKDFYCVREEDLPYVQFMEGIPITKEWCEKLDFDVDSRIHESGNYDWTAERGCVRIKSLDGKVTVRVVGGGITSILEHIECVHELQNLYFWLHYQMLIIKEEE